MFYTVLRGDYVKRQKYESFGSYEVLRPLFKNDTDVIRTIPYDLLMGDIRKKLVDCIYAGFYPDIKKYRIRSTNGTIRLRTYLEYFTRNLFKCALTLSEYSGTGKHPIPFLLFHGTTTKLLKNIMKDGLSTATAGTCWKEDLEKKVFLTDSLYAAEFYAHNATLKLRGTPVILILRSENINVKLKAGPERFQRKHSTIFDYYCQIWSEEDIPSKNIEDVLKFPRKHAVFQVFGQINDYYNKTFTDD